jgi:hypothetical protein
MKLWLVRAELFLADGQTGMTQLVVLFCCVLQVHLKMARKDVECKGMDWIYLALEIDKWWAVVNI